ncbi:hypothetical protein G210_3162 [Candida maltosa Xu316]|uniref:Uncharacterized protein n=1 Tax=Candida maltosa (strain Xu316) TaxID=1245528 RepID=M3J3W0_CANMX|nr:hypothetical protein G210_3162 [Candida maltosa Xu316]
MMIEKVVELNSTKLPYIQSLATCGPYLFIVADNMILIHTLASYISGVEINKITHRQPIVKLTVNKTTENIFVLIMLDFKGKLYASTFANVEHIELLKLSQNSKKITGFSFNSCNHRVAYSHETCVTTIGLQFSPRLTYSTLRNLDVDKEVKEISFGDNDVLLITYFSGKTRLVEETDRKEIHTEDESSRLSKIALFTGCTRRFITTEDYYIQINPFPGTLINVNKENLAPMNFYSDQDYNEPVCEIANTFVYPAHNESITGFDSINELNILVTVSDNELKIWNIKNQQLIAKIENEKFSSLVNLQKVSENCCYIWTTNINRSLMCYRFYN